MYKFNSVSLGLVIMMVFVMTVFLGIVTVIAG